MSDKLLQTWDFVFTTVVVRSEAAQDAILFKMQFST